LDNSIAIIDDDHDIRASVIAALESEGFQATGYADGMEALRVLAGKPADLVILDIKMPRIDGIEVLAQLRKQRATPVIFLTSKDDEVDEMLGLRLGADDYIKKPVSHRLLIERVRALLRRVELQKDDSNGEPVVRCGELTLDPGRHQCTWKGRDIDLSVTEFLILKALALRAGHVRSREQLMDGAYGENIYVDDRTIDTHIKRLRQKFKAVDDSFARIETLYGVGYRYRDGE
jgi:two-component system response regulator ChvI